MRTQEARCGGRREVKWGYKALERWRERRRRWRSEADQEDGGALGAEVVGVRGIVVECSIGREEKVGEALPLGLGFEMVGLHVHKHRERAGDVSVLGEQVARDAYSRLQWKGERFVLQCNGKEQAAEHKT